MERDRERESESEREREWEIDRDREIGSFRTNRPRNTLNGRRCGSCLC